MPLILLPAAGGIAAFCLAVAADVPEVAPVACAAAYVAAWAVVLLVQGRRHAREQV